VEGRISAVEDTADGMKVGADILGREVHFRLHASGLHLAGNAVGALLAVAAADGDVLNAAAALSDFAALQGRGARISMAFGGGRIELIDESYNANPASMVAAFDVLSRIEPDRGGRRVAVLGDMLELGMDSQPLHAGLAEHIVSAGVDAVFLCGPFMKSLWNELPGCLRGGHAENSAALASEVVRHLLPGDVVLVKGSFGSRMSTVIAALKAGAGKAAA
jgi:UDP-N-acetylmuramoyl-tripeptide--D-alanyl-D-alanine ligase